MLLALRKIVYTLLPRHCGCSLSDSQHVKYACRDLPFYRTPSILEVFPAILI